MNISSTKPKLVGDMRADVIPCSSTVSRSTAVLHFERECHPKQPLNKTFHRWATGDWKEPDLTFGVRSRAHVSGGSDVNQEHLVPQLPDAPQRQGRAKPVKAPAPKPETKKPKAQKAGEITWWGKGCNKVICLLVGKKCNQEIGEIQGWVPTQNMYRIYEFVNLTLLVPWKKKHVFVATLSPGMIFTAWMISLSKSSGFEWQSANCAQLQNVCRTQTKSQWTPV